MEYIFPGLLVYINPAETMSTVYFVSLSIIGAAEEWILQGTDQTEGYGSGGKRFGPTG